MKVLRSLRAWGALITVLAVMLMTASPYVAPGVQAATTSKHHPFIDCSRNKSLCVDVAESDEVFGHYVGHDEPATLFYSNQPGSGNRMRYELTLPKDPPGRTATAGKAFNFQLHPAFWFGMAMCDTQSYPEQVSTCTPDSDSNITTNLAQHPGTAFMELQFYPPGWVPWPTFTGCDARKWCAALNVDSLSIDPVNGTALNFNCASLTGLEYVNFAFITKDGQSQAPANPVQSTFATFTPDAQKDLFMNSGDKLTVTLHDTEQGLETEIDDLTTGQSGSMTSSADNGFGQVKFAPTPSTECTNIPYDFHPMYSTSSEQTRVIWAAHSYNIAFSDEIGHFDYCDAIHQNGACIGNEGVQGDQEPADGDNLACIPATFSSRIQVSGCVDTNAGFDGVSYQPVWPDGNTRLHPTPIRFTSPLTGKDYNTNYKRMAFEANLPAIEGPPCDITTGANCTLIPITDDGQPANFYPFFSITQPGNDCQWLLGNDIPGVTANDFGQNAQYGSILGLSHLRLGGGGAVHTVFADFRQILSKNPCPAE